MNLDRISRFKNRIAKLQREADQAKGASEQLIQQLKLQFGCDSIAEGKRKIRRLLKSKARLTKQLEEQQQTFIEEWGDELFD